MRRAGPPFLPCLIAALSALGGAGCGVATSLKPTEALITNAQQAFQSATSEEAVRYAPDAFLAAKNALQEAETAWKEARHSSDLTFSQRREQSARTSAYRAWQQAEFSSTAARQAKTQETMNKLQTEITQYRTETQLFTAEAQAAKEQQAKELAEAGKTQALEKARAEESAKDRALREKAQAELQVARETAEKERALKAMQELETKLIDAMKEIAKVREEKRGLIISLSDILFDFGKATLHTGIQDKLAQLAKILAAYPDRHIVVEGHTDNVGSDALNMQLSEARAESVRTALIANGIRPEMITAMGYGKSKPVASNDTPEGRQQNRRVEVVVLNPSPDNINAQSGAAAAQQPPAPSTP